MASPVHAHDGTERLEPKRVSEAAQQLVAPRNGAQSLDLSRHQDGSCDPRASQARVRHEAEGGRFPFCPPSKSAFRLIEGSESDGVPQTVNRWDAVLPFMTRSALH